MKLTYKAGTHAYWLDGKRAKGASSVAKAADDQTNLNRWKLRQAAKGLALNPDMLLRVAAVADDKDAFDDLIEEAVKAAGGTKGRDRGTAIHAITDKIDTDWDVLETPQVKEIREGWQRLLAEHDLTVVRSEFVIAHPEHRIAGRCDRVVRDSAGRLIAGDIKTGENADRYLHAHAVQLWLYASAPHIAEGPGGDVDFTITEWEDNPGIDQKVGYVFHLPTEGDWQLVPVDLTAGRDCFQRVILPLYAWRKRDDLRVAKRAAPAPVADPKAKLLERVARIKALGDKGVDTLIVRWPVGVAGPKKADEWTVEQYPVIAAVLTKLEADLSVPFDDVDVAEAPAADVKPAPEAKAPKPQIVMRDTPEEGMEIGAEQIAAVRADARKLEGDARTALETWAKDQQRNGLTLGLDDHPTFRRLLIAQVMTALAQTPISDADRRELVCAVMRCDEQASIATGCYLAALTIAEATQLIELAYGLVEGGTVKYLTDGPVVTPKAA